jgi:SOS-response transcriptional repressor LexA
MEMVVSSVVNRRESILCFIIGYHAKHQYAPSIREIAQGVGLKSPATVHTHLRKLMADGFISYDWSIPRTIIVKDNDQMMLREARQKAEALGLG